MKNKHTFHIPVMGTAFTIDTPVKVAKYGISSVVSLVDDSLAEKMREYYSKQLGIEFEPITDKHEDFRAKRFTEYLNLIDIIIKNKFEEIKTFYKKNVSEIHKYFDLLPDAQILKEEFNSLIGKSEYAQKVKSWLNKNMSLGSIDVNIMTKLDKANYNNSQKLPVEFNDAHSSLRGYALSNLDSSLVLSAGMNPRLYSYIEQFDEFYPDASGHIKKKIIIKVSDFRSAIIQGKFLAKKGLWVSEYRIESGLNCGGHAFATDGYLMGPILEEFKNKKEELVNSVHSIYIESLKAKNRPFPSSPFQLLITAQGGVGTSKEHSFLLNHYNLDSIGWGTPFLLVPEVTNVDKDTLQILCNAKEEDLYLSGVSPLGVPFNTVRGTTQESYKKELIAKDRPGSSCPKKFLLFNTEFTEKEICTASRQYQHLKLNLLNSENLSTSEYDLKANKIVEKECLCTGLSNSVAQFNGDETKKKNIGVSICPGPNLAYFNQVLSLKKMVDHIYGKINIMNRSDRPNMFIKELSLYYNYLKEKFEEIEAPFSDKQIAYFNKFISNINDGISYYRQLFSEVRDKFDNIHDDLIADLEYLEKEFNSLFEPAKLNT